MSANQQGESYVNRWMYIMEMVDVTDVLQQLQWMEEWGQAGRCVCKCSCAMESVEFWKWLILFKFCYFHKARGRKTKCQEVSGGET